MARRALRLKELDLAGLLKAHRFYFGKLRSTRTLLTALQCVMDSPGRRKGIETLNLFAAELTKQHGEEQKTLAILDEVEHYLGSRFPLDPHGAACRCRVCLKKEDKECLPATRVPYGE